MTNQPTDEGMTMIKQATQLFDAITAGPLWLLVAGVAFCLSFFLTWLKAFPNSAVAPTVVLVSTLLYGLFGDPKVYGAQQRYPTGMLICTGFILGTAVWGGHRIMLLILKRKIEALFPGFALDDKQPQTKKDDINANDSK